MARNIRKEGFASGDLLERKAVASRHYDAHVGKLSKAAGRRLKSRSAKILGQSSRDNFGSSDPFKNRKRRTGKSGGQSDYDFRQAAARRVNYRNRPKTAGNNFNFNFDLKRVGRTIRDSARNSNLGR